MTTHNRSSHHPLCYQPASHELYGAHTERAVPIRHLATTSVATPLVDMQAAAPAVGEVFVVTAVANGVATGEWMLPGTSSSGGLAVCPVQIGENAEARADETAAVGCGAIAGTAAPPATRGTSVGFSTQATGASSAAYGDRSSATATDSIAIGRQTTATATNALAIGTSADATAIDSTAIGRDAQATAVNALAAGPDAQGTAQSSIAMGRMAIARGLNSVVIGDNAHVNVAVPDADDAVCIGRDAQITSGNLTVAVGRGATCNGNTTVAIGNLANAGAIQAVAIGSSANASLSGSIALGPGATVLGTHLFGIGIAAGAVVGTVGGAGAAAATPVSPESYLRIRLNGVDLQIPCYLP